MINGAIGSMVWAAEQYYSIDRHAAPEVRHEGS